MIVAELAMSLLRLPAGAPETSGVVPPDGLRARLDELARREFNGRIVLHSDRHSAELLICAGEPHAAAWNDAGSGRRRIGQEALDALMADPEIGWTYSLESIEGPLLQALTGLGASARLFLVGCSDDLREILRTLA